MFQWPLFQQKRIKNHQNFFVKNLEDQRIRLNIRQKVQIKIQQMSIDIFSNQTLYDLTHCLC